MAGGALASKLERSGLLLVTPPLGLTMLGELSCTISAEPLLSKPIQRLLWYGGDSLAQLLD